MNQTTKSPDSDTVTDGIRIRAAAKFAPEQSDPDRRSYVYTYHIEIENVGEESVQLRSRHWIVLDANGERDDVRGAGVVGEQPELEPGKSFAYDSRCVLATRWGTMEGTYTFRGEDGREFPVQIGRFFLVPSSDAV